MTGFIKSTVFIIFSVIPNLCSGQSGNSQYLDNKIYFFDNYFFDIESLSKVKVIDEKFVFLGQNNSSVILLKDSAIISYNKNSLLADPLTDLSELNIIYDLNYLPPAVVYYKNKKFVLEQWKNIITVYDPVKRDSVVINDNKDERDGYLRDKDFIIAAADGVVYVKSLDVAHGYRISKYDESGKELYSFNTDFFILEWTNYPDLAELYLNHFYYSKSFLVLTSDISYNNASRTALISLDSAYSYDIRHRVNGIVTNEENELSALLAYDKNTYDIRMYDLNGKMIWYYTYSDKQTNISEISAVMKDDKIILCLYSPISSGADLIALDSKTGELTWQANVEQVNAEHSKYYNRVKIYSYGNKILMEGYEACGSYFQVFALSNGERLYSDMKTDTR